MGKIVATAAVLGLVLHAPAARADLEGAMSEFLAAHPVPGTQATQVFGADGGSIQWVDGHGYVTHEVEFDGEGNPSDPDPRLTPNGRARQNVEAHAPEEGGIDFSYEHDGWQIREVRWSGDDGSRGHIKFDGNGNAWWGEFFGPGGVRSGGFYDRRLDPTVRPPTAASIVPGPVGSPTSGTTPAASAAPALPTVPQTPRPRSRY